MGDQRPGRRADRGLGTPGQREAAAHRRVAGLTWYDMATTVADPVPVANWMHIEDGKITRIRVASMWVSGIALFGAAVLAAVLLPRAAPPPAGRAEVATVTTSVRQM
jgi:hypothetical protein